MKIIDNFLQEVTSSFHLFLDLDGVLVDWDRGIEALGYGTVEEIKNKHGTDFIWKLLSKEGESFWKNLEWTQDGKQLWEFCQPFHPTILSAPTNDNSSRTGKIIWVKQHLGPDVKLILEKSKDKHKHAKPGYILIDDRPENIKDWRKHVGGGIGILHKNAEDTISNLKKILKK